VCLAGYRIRPTISREFDGSVQQRSPQIAMAYVLRTPHASS
jgi:hypothetical protein